MSIPKSTLALARRLSTKVIDSMPVVENFAVFIDTHRDYPHIGTFEEDLHRGVCKPTAVNMMAGADGSVLLQNADTKRLLKLHEKHLFVGVDWFADWIVNYLMTSGEMPIDDEGKMSTKLLRDPRTGIYLLKSYGAMVRERAIKERLLP